MIRKHKESTLIEKIQWAAKCLSLKPEYELIHPRNPITNEIVTRFSGKLGKYLISTGAGYFNTAEDAVADAHKYKSLMVERLYELSQELRQTGLPA
ncbi:MAG: hypothetical protein JSS75_07355 [Bacteroidetes bacterium]|nr:hypothetical protein [Bacteroidota bacterium]